MNRLFFKIVLLICLTGATYAELPIASENDQKTDFTNCDWNFKEIWDEYLESNDKEFNSQGYLYAVSGENDKCEYGVGQDKKEAFNDCTKWKEENDTRDQPMEWSTAENNSNFNYKLNVSEHSLNQS